MKNLIYLTVFLTAIVMNTSAHEKCATMKHWENIKATDPDAELRKQQLEILTQRWIAENKGKKKQRSIITIPVVVHVLYHTNTENISDAQVYSQIDGLNWDFRLQNEDSLAESHPFWIYSADTEIEFCLATQDPNGNSTTGITRTYTDSTSFAGYDSEKFGIYGGKDNWDPTKYLNIWVCNLDASGGTLGYATFPSELAANPELDGVVIDFRAFGYTGTAGTDGFDENDLGRTATHEVGHWLNLNHIWGDAFCGDDMVADTPPQEEDNSGCPSFPSFPYNSCGGDSLGEMYMNYMDYVDDACMVMFTFGQADRMDAALFNARASLLNSTACSAPVGIAKNDIDDLEVNIFPNPSSGTFYINVLDERSDDTNIKVINILGEIVYETTELKSTGLRNYRIDLSGMSQGTYFISIKSGESEANKKVIIKN